MSNEKNNETLYIIIGAALIILALWLIIKFIGFILDHKLITAIIIGIVLIGIVYVSQRKTK